MTAETTQPHPLPVIRPAPLPGLPQPGDYLAPADRCIVELSARTGPLTTLRMRFDTTAARLTVADDADRSTLQVSAAAASVRVPGRPLARRKLRGASGLHATRHPELQLVVQQFTQDGDDQLTAEGLLAVRGTTHPTRLRARIVKRTDNRLVLLARADVPYHAVRRASHFTLPRPAAARQLRLLLAADIA